MDNCKISVIVPCYNIEAYLEKTVRSILAQTYKNLEILLVDDGSTDDTSDIIDRLASENTCVFAFHKENGGVSSARLYGIKQSTGGWITFVDGDDLLKSEMYSFLIENAYEYKADISHCGYEMVFPDHVDKYYGTGKLVLQNNFEGLRDLLSGSFIEPGLWNKLYRRNLVLQAMDACSSSLDICNMEDLLWNYYLFKYSDKAVFSDECYYCYVLRKGSAATAQLNRHKLIDPLKVLRLIERDISDSEDLRHIVKARLATSLISLAALDTSVSPVWVRKYVIKARHALSKRKWCYLRGNYSHVLKVKVLLVSFSPKLYAFLYRVYSKVKGTDRKYDI